MSNENRATQGRRHFLLATGAAALTAQGYRVIVPYFRGYGRRGLPRLRHTIE